MKKNLERKQVEKVLYKLIPDEIRKKKFDDTCYMKALSEAKGDEKKAQGIYIDLRFEELLEMYVDDKERFFREIKNTLLGKQYEKIKEKRKKTLDLIKEDVAFKNSSSQYQSQLLKNIDNVFSLPDIDKNRIGLAESMQFIETFISKYNAGKTIETSISMADFLLSEDLEWTETPIYK